MFITTEPCQYCGSRQVEAPWTLCRDCRRVYAKTLHRLRRDMMLLQQVSRHAYKLGEPGAGGKPQGGAAPARDGAPPPLGLDPRRGGGRG